MIRDAFVPSEPWGACYASEQRQRVDCALMLGRAQPDVLRIFSGDYYAGFVKTTARHEIARRESLETP